MLPGFLPVKTMASIVGRVVAAAAMPAAARRTNSSIASAARASPLSLATSAAPPNVVSARRRRRSPDRRVEVRPRSRPADRPSARSMEDDPGVDRPGAGAHHQALERRHAHRRVDRPTAIDRRHRAAAAEVRDDQRAGRRRVAPSSSACPSDGPVDRQAVEPEAADAVLAGRHASGPGSGWPPRAASRGTPCRRRRRAGRPAAPRAPRGWSPPRAGLWSGARSASVSMAASAASSISVGSVNRSPPWTTRCPTASIEPRLGDADARRPLRRSPSARSDGEALAPRRPRRSPTGSGPGGPARSP